MITLAEELRRIQDTVEEYGNNPAPTRAKKKSNVVPGTPEGVVAAHILTAAEDILYKMGDMSKLSDEKRHEIEAKLGELVRFAREELQ